MREVFGSAIDTARVTVRRSKWWWFQLRNVTMAPTGHLHFHPLGESYCEDFSTGSPSMQRHFIHEMTHVWQMQTKGWWYVPLWGAMQRRYSYTLKPGKPLEAYGIEQQAEIVADAFMMRRGWKAAEMATAAHSTDDLAKLTIFNKKG
ncbi:MAG: vgr related protein [Novosphingobium sp.]